MAQTRALERAWRSGFLKRALPQCSCSHRGTRATPCPKVPQVKVVCFIAVPGRTVGEARFAGQYAERHGWHSLMLVPSRAQATRARLLLKRCFPGKVVVVPASFQLTHFPFEVGYEWAALVKALLVDRHC